jgi:hypothetical protein
MTGPPDDSTADLQAVITALRAERDRALSEKATLAEELAARTGELTQRDSGYSERIGHQAATETLKVENQELRAAQAAGLGCSGHDCLARRHATGVRSDRAAGSEPM